MPPLTAHWLTYEPSLFLLEQKLLNRTPSVTTVELRFAISFGNKVLVFDGGQKLGISPVNGSSLEEQVLQKLRPILQAGKLTRVQFVDFGFRSPLHQVSDDGTAMYAVILITVEKCALTEPWVSENFTGLKNPRMSDDLTQLDTSFGNALGSLVIPRVELFDRGYVKALGEGQYPNQAIELCRDTIQSEVRCWSTIHGTPWRHGLVAYIFDEPDKGIWVQPMDREVLDMIREPECTELTLGDVRYQILTFFEEGQVVLEDRHMSELQLASRMFQENGRANIQTLRDGGALFERTIRGRPLYRNGRGDIRDSPGKGFEEFHGLQFLP